MSMCLRAWEMQVGATKKPSCDMTNGCHGRKVSLYGKCRGVCVEYEGSPVLHSRCQKRKTRKQTRHTNWHLKRESYSSFSAIFAKRRRYNFDNIFFVLFHLRETQCFYTSNSIALKNAGFCLSKPFSHISTGAKRTKEKEINSHPRLNPPSYANNTFPLNVHLQRRNEGKKSVEFATWVGSTQLPHE